MRDYDLILFGVTGYTGRLVAEALLESDIGGLRWAFAGRTQSKLEAARERIAQRFPEANAIPLVACSAIRADRSLNGMTYQLACGSRILFIG